MASFKKEPSNVKPTTSSLFLTLDLHVHDTSLSARTEVCILGYPISIERPCQKHTTSLLQKFDEKSVGKNLHHCWKESKLTGPEISVLGT